MVGSCARAAVVSRSAARYRPAMPRHRGNPELLSDFRRPPTSTYALPCAISQRRYGDNGSSARARWQECHSAAFRTAAAFVEYAAVVNSMEEAIQNTAANVTKLGT